MDKPFVLTVSLDQRILGRQRVERTAAFVVELPLPRPASPGAHTVEVRASTWFVPDHFARNGDHRPLSWRLGGVDLGAPPYS